MWNAEQRRRALGEHLQRLAAAVEEVESQAEQLTNGQKALLADMQAILDALPGAIDTTWQGFEAVQDEAERERSRRDLCANFEEVVQNLIHEIIPVLTGSSGSLVPVELEPVLQEQLDDANLGAGYYKPILYAAPELNYSVVPLPTAAEVLDKVGAVGGQPDPDQQLLSLSTPTIAKDSIALHVILLGHELGHVREWETHIAAGFKQEIPEKWKDADGNLDLQYEEAFSTYVELVATWGEELVADIFSTMLLGPVALLALPELIGTAAELTADSESHPGTDRRILLMAELLRERGFDHVDFLGDAIIQYFEQHRTAWEREADIEGMLDQDPVREAWSELRSRINDFKAGCAGQLGQAVLGPTIWTDVLLARDLLRRGLPCSEIWHDDTIGRTSLAVILNAAWLVKVHDLADLASVLGVTTNQTSDLGAISQVLDRLVVKSIEISNDLKAPQ